MTGPRPTAIKTPTRARVRADNREAPKGVLAPFRPISELIPYARNSRTHSDEQITELVGFFQEYGFTNPVLADADGIVAGHGRTLAAQRLYDAGRTIYLPDGTPIPKGTLPVIDCTGWSKAKRRAYIIADNKVALKAGWDEQLLALEFQDLEAEGFDLTLTGFDLSEIADLKLTLNPDFSAGSLNDQGRLDEKKAITCPHCGESFTPEG